MAEDPKLRALLVAAKDDPAQRELTTGVSLELQKELGTPETERRILTRQGLADLTGQIEAAPPAQRTAFAEGAAGGTPVPNMVKTLRRNGIVDARSKRFATIEQLAQGTNGEHPAIAIVQVRRGELLLAHAVVVDGVTVRHGKRVVSIRDPANGEASHVPVEQFDRRMRKFGRIVIFTNPHRGSTK